MTTRQYILGFIYRIDYLNMHLQSNRHALAKWKHCLCLVVVYIKLHSIMGFMGRLVDIFRDSFFEDLAFYILF